MREGAARRRGTALCRIAALAPCYGKIDRVTQGAHFATRTGPIRYKEILRLQHTALRRPGRSAGYLPSERAQATHRNRPAMAEPQSRPGWHQNFL